jgi:hypothetical protein
MRHSIESTLYLIFLLALAVGLSFFEDALTAWHRSPVLIYGAHYASVYALVVEITAWALLISIGLYRVFARLITRDEENSDEVSI